MDMFGGQGVSSGGNPACVWSACGGRGRDLVSEAKEVEIKSLGLSKKSHTGSLFLLAAPPAFPLNPPPVFVPFRVE